MTLLPVRTSPAIPNFGGLITPCAKCSVPKEQDSGRKRGRRSCLVPLERSSRDL